MERERNGVPAPRDPLAELGDDDLRHLCDAVADVIETDYETADGSPYQTPEVFDALHERLDALCEARGL